MIPECCLPSPSIFIAINISSSVSALLTSYILPLIVATAVVRPSTNIIQASSIIIIQIAHISHRYAPYYPCIVFHFPPSLLITPARVYIHIQGYLEVSYLVIGFGFFFFGCMIPLLFSPPISRLQMPFAL